MTAKKDAATPIDIPRLNIQEITITLIGDSPLIMHKWSDKAKRAILDKQMKRAKGAKEARDPEREYKDSIYEHPDGGYGFPVVAFKSAAVDACSHVDGVTKVEARGAFHINGDFVKIEGKPEMREDTVRIGMDIGEIRYRAMFAQWRTRFTIRYNVNVLSPAQIQNLFNVAGFAIGVGEWRPQKDGSFGMFHVEQSKE